MRDANARVWTDQDLTISVNLGRDRVVMDAVATRVKARITLLAAQEAYTFATVFTAIQSQSPLVQARGVAAILNINFNWSTAFNPPLKRMSWTDLNRVYRSNPVNSFPEAWAMYDLTSFYLQPTVPSTYTADVDCVYLPTLLVNPNDAEVAIIDPLTELVPLMAARWATYYEQDKARAEEYMAHYQVELVQMMNSMPPFSFENRYM